MFLASLSVPTYADNIMKKILILNSNRTYTPWEELVSRSIRSKIFLSGHILCQISEEYLDLGAFSDKEEAGVVHSLLKAKYDHQPMDLVIAVNDGASNLLTQYGTEMFPGAALLISGGGRAIYKFPPKQLPLTSVYFEEDVLGALESALHLLPKTTHVFVVIGSSPVDHAYKEKVQRQLNRLESSLEVTYLADMSAADLRKRVSRLPPDSLIFFIMMMGDSTGEIFVPRKMCQTISREANAPVIGLYDTFMGYGILGGKLASAEMNGYAIAQSALRILAGEKPSDIPPVRAQDIQEFDWRQLKRWGLLNRPLPEGSIVEFKEYSFWDLYWGWILTATAVLALQMILILLLLVQRRLSKLKEMERRQATEALLKSEEASRQILQTAMDGFWRTDIQGRLLAVNEAYCRMSGYEEQELLAMSISDLEAVETAQDTAAHMRKVILKGEDRFESRHRRKDGSLFDVEVSIQYKQGKEGGECSVFLRDVTQRNKSEKRLKDSEGLFREIYNNMYNGVAIYEAVDVGQDFVFKGLNQAGLSGGKKNLQDIIGRSVREVFPGVKELGLFEVFKRVWKSGQPEHYASSFYHDKEITLWVENYVCKLPSGELVAIYDDTTARRQAEAESQKLDMQLRQAQKMEAVGTLAGGIAHDFNNILGAIVGYAEIASDDALAGKVKPEDISQIITAADRAKSLVQQILTFSRRVEPERKPLDINKEVEQAAELLAHTLPKMISIELRLSSDIDRVNADPNQLNQIILNLATNASQAMPEGGRLTIASDKVFVDNKVCSACGENYSGEWVALTISDTGHGIHREDLPRIFDPFFTTKEIGKGTGLGLATVHGIVLSHGGHVECQSELGQGTTFTVYFPIEIRYPKAVVSHAGVESEDLTGGSETILLVDDEESLRLLGTRTLMSKGYTVTTAGSGEEALEVYRHIGDQLDLVIMDLGMPGMGGNKAMKAILELNPRAKIIIASGYATQDQVKDALDSGRSGYMPKPFKKAELLATVRSVLDKT